MTRSRAFPNLWIESIVFLATCEWDFLKGLAASLKQGEGWWKDEVGGGAFLMVTLHDVRGYAVMINPGHISGIAKVPPGTHHGAYTRVRCLDGEVHLVRESSDEIRTVLQAEIVTLSGALQRLYAGECRRSREGART
jgi:hypothetical protein